MLFLGPTYGHSHSLASLGPLAPVCPYKFAVRPSLRSPAIALLFGLFCTAIPCPLAHLQRLSQSPIPHPYPTPLSLLPCVAACVVWSPTHDVCFIPTRNCEGTRVCSCAHCQQYAGVDALANVTFELLLATLPASLDIIRSEIATWHAPPPCNAALESVQSASAIPLLSTSPAHHHHHHSPIPFPPPPHTHHRAFCPACLQEAWTASRCHARACLATTPCSFPCPIFGTRSRYV
jgi:hypothetical protein